MMLALTLLASTIATTTDDTPSFERDVLPLFERSCTSCHRAIDDDGGPRKPKGGLALDSRHGITSGTRGGPVIRAGSSLRSRLIQVISLPAEDPDAMPPRGTPISSTERDVIAAWIDAGADFGSWTGLNVDVAEPAAESSADTRAARRVQLWAQLAAGLGPVSETALDAARDAGVLVESLSTTSPLLRVETRDVSRKTLATLAPLAKSITGLDLGRARINSDALQHLPPLPRLVRLDVDNARLDRRFGERLTTFPELRVVNLAGSDATDDVVDWLADVPTLEKVYLWNSRVSEAGAERLARARPDVAVSFTRSLPAPPPPDPDDEQQTTGRRR